MRACPPQKKTVRLCCLKSGAPPEAVAQVRHGRNEGYSEHPVFAVCPTGRVFALVYAMVLAARRLLMISCISVGIVSAENGPAKSDPFAAYHEAIESRLSAILEGDAAAPPAGIQRAELSASPEFPKEVEIRDFARRFWGGREAEFAAALGRL